MLSHQKSPHSLHNSHSTSKYFLSDALVRASSFPARPAMSYDLMSNELLQILISFIFRNNIQTPPGAGQHFMGVKY